MMGVVACGRRPVSEGARAVRPGRRSGITLTEILISIMILGIGLVLLATLFPIGLLRLRDAARASRSATLFETAAADAISRGLFNSHSFAQADYANYFANPNSPPFWYVTSSGQYNPLIQDTPYYGGDWSAGAYAGSGGMGIGPNQVNQVTLNSFQAIPGAGLAFAYDPLWRYQTYSTNNSSQGYYINDQFEARFGYGLTTVRNDSFDGQAPSAHGLQRLTNFNNPNYMPASVFVPNIFVSQEDIVWQDPESDTYTLLGQPGGSKVVSPSAVVPDLTPLSNPDPFAKSPGPMPSLDWRFSWMFTGQLTNANNMSTFDGNIVIFENRPFGIQSPANPPYTPAGNFASQTYQVDGETVVEGVFGYSGNVIDANGNPHSGPGYGSGADRTVLLRWSSSMPDPVVRPGDWIADVTYERQTSTMVSRFYGFGTGGVPMGLLNWANKGEWDNLPAQRCFWYQVQKVTEAVEDTSIANNSLRSMVVYVNQKLQARTVLNANGTPYYLNAALIAPNVINVIPQTIFVR